MADIHRIVLPTPFPVGPVNAYVLLPPARSGGRVALVDPGPAYPPAREALEKGLRELGVGLGDIEAVLLTHPHVDHYGLAREVAAASGASVVAHVEAVPHLGTGLRAYTPEERTALEGLLARAGAPRGFARSLFGQWAAADALAAPVRVTEAVADGDTVEGGGVLWRVIATPGHSPGAVCYYDAERRRLVSGDHLLPDISSNAIMDFQAAPGDDGPVLVRQKSLLIYIESLRKVEGLDVAEVLPGHGEPFADHRALIARRMRHYDSRKAAIASVLGRLGASPAFRVATTFFPEQTEPMGQFLALSEVLGHLDLLEAEGRVRLTPTRDLDLYCLENGG